MKPFGKMKLECNRLHSFENKWPLADIKPESLAKAGFFYLQQEDKVQCPFCHIVIYNWPRGDSPLREHIRKSPKCPFLLGLDVGNVPLRHKICPRRSSAAAWYKPKRPSMADVQKRILTFSGWPLIEPGPDILAKCGLYYSGISDVVTCFFCGGTLGNWDPGDDPWLEHLKFFPECSFLAGNPIKNQLTRLDSFSRERDSVLQPCNPIEKKLTRLDSFSRDNLLCTVCTERERDIVLQPCGHLVSCIQCSNLISNCPVCRRPIIHKIKAYLS